MLSFKPLKSACSTRVYFGSASNFFFLILIFTVSIIHMSAWVLHEVYKYITYP